MTTSTVDVRSGTAALTPVQLRTFTDLLAIGMTRPIAPPGIVEEIADFIETGTAEPLSRWTERSLWLSKGQVLSVLRCELSFVSDRAAGNAPGRSVASVVGDVSHRAIQLAYTFPGRPPGEYVRHALEAVRSADVTTGEFCGALTDVELSDLLVSATSRTTALLDSWPPLAEEWVPRFEEPLQAKVGSVTLAGRPDLVLGRPRPNGQQTMLLTDWKTGSLREEHTLEAGFYALVATLRNRVPPFRSTVYSLASGEYTEPDVTAATLRAAAAAVVTAATTVVDLLTGRREPEPSTDPDHLRWCKMCAPSSGQ